MLSAEDWLDWLENHMHMTGPDTEALIPRDDHASRYYRSRGVCVRCNGERFVTDPETGKDVGCPRCDATGEELS